MAGLATTRMSGGSKFHAAGAACEKARSPNLVAAVLAAGSLEADCRPDWPVWVSWIPVNPVLKLR